MEDRPAHISVRRSSCSIPPIVLALYFVTLRGCATPAARREPGLLRLGRRGLSPSCSPRPSSTTVCARNRGGHAAPPSPLAGHHRQPGPPRRLQVQRLRGRQREHAARVDRGAVARPPGADPAPRHLVLHVSRGVLPDGRLPRQGPGTAEPARRGAVHRAVPAAHRGADRPVRDHRAADRAAPHDVGRPRVGDPAVRGGAGEEGAHRQYTGQAGGCGVRCAALGAVGRSRLARRRLLCAPDLLRLLGLLGHGHRTRPDLRVPTSRRTFAIPRVALAHRVLATVAHLALDLVPRLPVRAARGNRRGPPRLPEPRRGVRVLRPLARRELDLPGLGLFTGSFSWPSAPPAGQARWGGGVRSPTSTRWASS